MTNFDDSLDQSSQRIVLLDSSAVLHRCFHGYPPRPSQLDGYGIEIGALRGYLEYVRILSRDIAYDRIIHVLDGPGGSHYRCGLFPGYKANRSPSHPALTAQFALLPNVLQAFGQEVTCVRGVESDDIMAILAREYADQGHMCLVVTKDKDLFQLVDGDRINVAQYREVGGYKTHDFFREQDVFAKMGVRPDQIPDYLAMMGDKVDGFNGVEGVGEKTAARLLQEYGDLATLITQAHTIKGKMGERIREAAADLPMFRQLATVMQEIPHCKSSDFFLRCTLDQEQMKNLRACVQPDRAWPEDLISDFLESAPAISPSTSSYRP